MGYILCNKCHVMLSCKKNDVCVRMGGAELKWGDVYKCPICGFEIITGFGASLFPWNPEYAAHIPSIEVEGEYSLEWKKK